MAITANTVFPIKPVALWGCEGPMPFMTFPVEASAGIVTGDLITESAGTAGSVEVRNVSAAGIAIGFAAGPATPGATVVMSDDVAKVYPCFPHAVFEGNIITAADGDETAGVAGDNLQRRLAIEEADTPAVAAVCITGTAIAWTLYYTRQKDGTMGVGSGVGKVNPRLAFVICDSVWAPLA